MREHIGWRPFVPLVKSVFNNDSQKGVRDETMKRATRARKLNGGEQKRNKKISRIRSPGENT